MSFWLFPLKEKGVDGLFLGVSRCYTYVMIKDVRTPAMGRTTWRVSLWRVQVVVSNRDWDCGFCV